MAANRSMRAKADKAKRQIGEFGYQARLKETAAIKVQRYPDCPVDLRIVDTFNGKMVQRFKLGVKTPKPAAPHIIATHW